MVGKFECCGVTMVTFIIKGRQLVLCRKGNITGLLRQSGNIRSKINIE